MSTLIGKIPCLTDANCAGGCKCLKLMKYDEFAEKVGVCSDPKGNNPACTSCLASASYVLPLQEQHSFLGHALTDEHAKRLREGD